MLTINFDRLAADWALAPIPTIEHGIIAHALLQTPPNELREWLNVCAKGRNVEELEYRARQAYILVNQLRDPASLAILESVGEHVRDYENDHPAIFTYWRRNIVDQYLRCVSELLHNGGIQSQTIALPTLAAYATEIVDVIHPLLPPTTTWERNARQLRSQGEDLATIKDYLLIKVPPLERRAILDSLGS